MMDLWKSLAESAPALFGVVAALVLILGVVLTPLFNLLGIVVSGGDKKVDEKRQMSTVPGNVDAINEKLGGIERRLGSVEQEVGNRPTRAELHQLELKFAEMVGEYRVQGMTIQATATAISRIEDHLYSEAFRPRGTAA